MLANSFDVFWTTVLGSQACSGTVHPIGDQAANELVGDHHLVTKWASASPRSFLFV